MNYDIRQITTYTYGAPVGHAHHVLRLAPLSRPGQVVQALSLDIAPVPAQRLEGEDFFGNRLTRVHLDTAHDRLAIELCARVTVEGVAVPDMAGTPQWEAVRAAAAISTDPGPQGPAHGLFPSRQVALDAEITAYARESFAPGRPVLEGARDLTARIKRDFAYVTGVTNVSTSPRTSFAERRGVCQDFAHVMIAGLRGLGLPAGYVSGYLRTVPKDDGRRLAGAADDAMHAWVQIWCGAAHGWIGLDPTNDLLAGEDHIVVAVGRDYADVAPVDGVVLLSGVQSLEVAVRVRPA